MSVRLRSPRQFRRHSLVVCPRQSSSPSRPSRSSERQRLSLSSPLLPVARSLALDVPSWGRYFNSHQLRQRLSAFQQVLMPCQVLKWGSSFLSFAGRILPQLPREQRDRELSQVPRLFVVSLRITRQPTCRPPAVGPSGRPALQSPVARGAARSPCRSPCAAAGPCAFR